MWVLWLSISVVLIVLIILLSKSARKKQAERFAAQNKPTVLAEKSTMQFSVEQMKCQGCIDAVTKALQQLENTELVEINLAEKKAVVTSVLQAEEIAKIITDAGFPAKAV